MNPIHVSRESKLKFMHRINVYILKILYQFFLTNDLYNQYTLGSLPIARVNPRQVRSVRKSSAVRYFILTQCGAVQGFSYSH